jgi:hypothetical protein|tara:strand:- start:885 stop:1496 length:612 start_codon:yes stop_codon:yes gene_type:complete
VNNKEEHNLFTLVSPQEFREAPKTLSTMKQLALIFLILPMSFGFQLEEKLNGEITTYPTLSTDQTNSLNVHNRARAQVGVKPVQWSNKLAREAQEYANFLARTNQFKHSSQTSRKGAGENLYWYSSTTEAPLTDASQSWYEEIEIYRYRACCGNNFQNTGHYTQMVWSKTNKIGIASAVSARGETYVVARYNPSGNVRGRYPY